MARLTEVESKVVAAWREAERDLGIRFTSPFILSTTDGERLEFLGLVHDFGRRLGMLISVIEEPACAVRVPTGDDYGRSQLAADYGEYRRQLFIDTLDDWQFLGPDSERPAWYTGKTWGS
jgi:hypothetical protein